MNSYKEFSKLIGQELKMSMMGELNFSLGYKSGSAKMASSSTKRCMSCNS